MVPEMVTIVTRSLTIVLLLLMVLMVLLPMGCFSWFAGSAMAAASPDVIVIAGSLQVAVGDAAIVVVVELRRSSILIMDPTTVPTLVVD
uniref:Uncharacterized protein n=1 Tax=Anopheles darlingi TaxID=43151 RepID=A0A2M4D675_ANODA